jgi:hypothetical protein
VLVYFVRAIWNKDFCLVVIGGVMVNMLAVEPKVCGSNLTEAMDF